MKKEKKILSFYTARKFDFIVFASLSVGLIYFTVIEFTGRTYTQPFRTINYILAGILAVLTLILAYLEIRYKKDKDDELARYDMGIVHEKFSKIIPVFMIVCTIICFFIKDSVMIEINRFDLVLILLLPPSLYLTAEQGLFLIIHGRESPESEGESDE